MRLKKLQSFNDVNGKPSGKRRWAAIIIINALLLTYFMVLVKILTALEVFKIDIPYEIETPLILGMFTTGAGLFASTVLEKPCLPINEIPPIKEFEG